MKVWYEISNGFLVRPDSSNKTVDIIITNNEREPVIQYRFYERHIARLMNLIAMVFHRWCIYKLEELNKEEPVNDEEAKAKQKKLETLTFFEKRLSQMEISLIDVINEFELDD